MNLEVGMYVRNDYFGIGKIDKDYFDSNNKHWFNVQFNCYGDDDCHCGICEQSIGYKASHNLIDLIEVGDYVNGYKVMEFDDDYYDDDLDITVEENSIVLGNEEGMFRILPKDIKSIVTKEQFKSIEYTVKE